MTELPSEAKAFLELTRDGHGPPDTAARERVRQRIAAALASGAALSAGKVAAAHAARHPRGVTAKLRGALLAKVRTKLAIVASAGVLVGATWFVLPRQPEPSARSRQLASPSSSAEPAATPPANPVRPATTVQTTQADAPQPAGARASAPLERHAPAAAAVPRPTRPAQRARKRHGGQLPAQDLAAELAFLHRASEAIASGEAELALSMLQSYRTRFTRPQLQEEREGLIALARCTLDAGDARPARSFVARYPASVLSARVRQACALE